MDFVVTENPTEKALKADKAKKKLKKKKHFTRPKEERQAKITRFFVELCGQERMEQSPVHI